MSLDRSEASIRLNQNTRNGKNHLKLKSIVRKSQNQVFENQSPYCKSNQDWDKVRDRSITQRKQEPGIKTKQTRMKGKRVRSKTTAKWHHRLPRTTGGVAWHICY